MNRGSSWTSVALAVLALAQPPAAPAPLRPVEGVDLSRYAGRWYEIARLPNRFQDQCTGDVVVHYALRSDARLDVVNQCRQGDGQIDRATGIARRAAGAKNDAVLQVRFAPAIFSFMPGTWGDYWIIGLGPEYTWAVVGVPSREYLWILSRTPAMSAPAYEQALEIAKGKGFETSRLRRTTHTRP